MCQLLYFVEIVIGTGSPSLTLPMKTRNQLVWDLDSFVKVEWFIK